MVGTFGKWHQGEQILLSKSIEAVPSGYANFLAKLLKKNELNAFDDLLLYIYINILLLSF